MANTLLTLAVAAEDLSYTDSQRPLSQPLLTVLLTTSRPSKLNHQPISLQFARERSGASGQKWAGPTDLRLCEMASWLESRHSIKTLRNALMRFHRCVMRPDDIRDRKACNDPNLLISPFRFELVRGRGTARQVEIIICSYPGQPFG
jgi:hypothetical protein